MNTRHHIVALGLVLSGSLGAAVPVVDNVRVSSRVGQMEVLYDLSGRAVVTMDVLTNGVSIGARNFTTVQGAVNRLVDADTDCRIRWRPGREWPGVDLSDVTVKLTAWATNAPPDYLVYDFVAHTTNFYPCVEALPDGGLANDVYRTDRIVLRKIPAKGVEWVMGCFDKDVGATSDAVAHMVTLTEDFYMAIYETTQAQYVHSGSTYAKDFAYTKEDAAIHPADTVNYWHLHGDWPTCGRKAPSGAAALFRSKSGIDFDLPTEAQWEYACRAGTRTMVNTGHALSSASSDANMNAAAWSNANSSEGYTTYSSHVVGTRLPNAWGLYDMHGNATG